MELTLPNLIQVLGSTLERNAEGKLAENQLKEWSVSANYHYHLQSVYLDISLPLQIRWLSIIQFKNGIEKYWRINRKAVIPKEEKEQIINRVFDLVDEGNSQLMIQNAHSTARIARIDFPTNWSNIFSQIEHLLLQGFNEKNLVRCYNVLTILNQVVKNVGLVRIGKAKIAMQSKIPALTPLIINIYTVFFKQWLSSPSNIDPSVVDVDYLCLKVLRRILVDGYHSPHSEELVNEFFKANLSNFQTLLLEYKKLEETDPSLPITEKIEKFLKCQCKLYYNFVYAHPNSFILLKNSTDILMTLLNILQNQASSIYNSMDDDSFWSLIAIRSLLLLKKLITLNKKGETTLIKSSVTKQDMEVARAKLNTFLSNDLIISLTELVINWYLKLKPLDLENWNDNPEEFVNEEISESWEYQIRPCAEHFFQHLIISYKDLLVPFVLNKINEINEKIANSGYNMELILLKDSIFAIIQLSGVAIADMVDFDIFLVNILLPSLDSGGSSNNNNERFMELKVLKRRICLVINEWVSIKCSRENRVRIHELLLSFFNLDDANNNDKVLQLSTVQTLKNVIEEWDFNKHDFRPFSSQFINKLLVLLKQMDLAESKIFILNCLNSILDKNGSLIETTELNSLLAAFPSIWAYFESHEENLLIKNILIRSLKNLIKCFKNSKVTAGISFEIINTCCAYNSDYYNVLSEDGFELWQAVLEYYPTIGDLSGNYVENDEALQNLIFDKFKLIYDPLINTTEILPLVLSIIRSYFIITPIEILLENADLKQLVLGILTSIAGNLAAMRDDALEVVISILDVLFVKVYKFYQLDQLQNGGENPYVAAFFKIMEESNIFRVLIEIVADDENNSILTINKLLLVVSRFFFGNSDLIVELLQSTFAQDGSSAAFKQFFNNWLINSKNLFEARKKKLNLLGLGSVLALSGNNDLKSVIFIKENINLIFSMWSTYLDEINENDQGDCKAYYKDFNFYEFDLIFTNKQELQDAAANGAVDNAQENLDIYRVDETEEFKRYEFLLTSYDPVHKVSLKKQIQAILTHLEREFGADNYRQLLSLVDQGFTEHLQMKL